MNEGDRSSDIRFYLELGRVYKKARRFEEALAALQKALDLAPDYADLNFEVGVVYDGMGDRQAAIDHYQRALEANPTYLAARIHLVKALLEQDRDQEAAHHQKLIEYVQEHKGLMHGLYGAKLANAHAEVGDLYAEIGLPAEAAEQYAKAARIAPRFGDIGYKLGRTYLQMNELQAARQALEAVIDKAAGYQIEAARLLGTVLLRLGRRNDAVDIWNDVLSKQPGDLETLALLEQVDG